MRQEQDTPKTRNPVVMLTGGAGYIGSHIAVELLQDIHTDIVIYDNFSNSSKKAIEAIEQITKRTVTVVEGDVRDYDYLRAAMIHYKPDAVIHLAGLKSVSESFASESLYWDVNVGGTMNLMKAAASSGCDNLVFSSSATVYRPQFSEALVESSELGVSNPYGATKMAAEMLFNKWNMASPRSTAVLRYFNPVGAHPSGLLGESPLSPPSNLIPFITRVALGRYKELVVFGDDYPTKDGTCERDYIHVLDLATAHVAALKYLRRGTKCVVANIGTGKPHSVMSVLRAYEQVVGRKIPHVMGQRRMGDLPRVYANAARATDLFGWSPKYSLVQSIAHEWNFATKGLFS